MIVSEQRKLALIELLTRTRGLDKGHPLNQRPSVFLDSGTSFGGTAHELYARALEMLSDPCQISIGALCNEIIDAFAKDFFPTFFQALSSAVANPITVTGDSSGDERNDSEDLSLQTHMDYKKAFNWPYLDTHTLEAFEEYLDVQWLEMCKLYQPTKDKFTGTKLSRVGSIIQSSCTGKSRLAQEYSPQYLSGIAKQAGWPKECLLHM